MTLVYQRNDQGLPLAVQIMRDGAPFDLSTATLVEIIIQQAGEDPKPFEAEAVGDGSDGIFAYDPEDGDLDPVGLWKMHAHCVGPGYNFHTAVVDLVVRANLE